LEKWKNEKMKKEKRKKENRFMSSIGRYE